MSAAGTVLAVVPHLALLAAVGAVVAGVMHLRGHGPARAWLRNGLLVATALALVGFLALVVLFIFARTEFQYVFLYTSTDIPLRYRIAGAWAGREGSLALWGMYAAAVAAAVAWRHRLLPDDDGRAWTETLLAAIAAAFLGAVAWQGTFDPTDAFLLRNRPGGNGLNPTLLSPFILIHPPVMFLAYALTAVPLAAAAASLVTGGQGWSRTAMLWSRMDWLLYTFAMGLGGIWAYYTLGFGGYWAWDPVEVANLLPWLALTLLLHAQLHHRRFGRYAHVGPLLACLPFLLTVFSTISTRSGLWVSVHAFTDPTGTFDPDAGTRILAILAREPGLQFHAALFLGVLLAFLALWARRLGLATGRLPSVSRIVAGTLGAGAVAAFLAPVATLGLVLEGASLVGAGRLGFGLLALTALAVLAPALPLLVGDEPVRRWRFDLQALNFTAVIVLGVGLIVLLLWHVAATNGWSTRAYLGRFPVLAAPAMLGLLAFQSHALWRRQALWLVGAVGVSAAAVFVLARSVARPSDGGGSPSAAQAAGASGGMEGAGALPALLVLGIPLVVVSLLRVARVAQIRSRPAVGWARAALWLAALLDVLFWVNPPTVRLGPLAWQPAWPAQLVFGGAALVALHLATMLLAGRARYATAAHVLTGVLGAYYIAPLVALGSWWVHRGHDEAVSSPDRRLHQVGLHGVHLAVALALLGYTLTTYVGVEEQLVIAPGDTVEIGIVEAGLVRVEQASSGGLVDRFTPVIATDGSVARAQLSWEPQSGSHYPLPATSRFWHGDAYYAIDGVCIDPSGACDGAADWVRAYEASSRLPAGVVVSQVELQASTLPGIFLVWGALFLWLYFMALMMRHGPET